MKRYYSNFSKHTLLLNIPISYSFEDSKRIIVKIPTIENLFESIDVQQLIGFFQNEGNIWDRNGLFIAKNVVEALIAMHMFLKETTLESTFNKIFINLEIKDDGVYIEDRKLELDEFNLILDSVLIGCGTKRFDEQNNTGDPAIDEWNRKQKELEDKVKGIKKDEEDKKSYEIDEMVFCIMSYFNQITIQDIKNMNYYTFINFFEKSLKLQVQKIQDIAAGNGLIKKYQPLY